MTASEILQSVQFVFDRHGKPSGALLDIRAWESLLALLEDAEDVELVRSRLKNWRSKAGWSRWEDFEAELDGHAV